MNNIKIHTRLLFFVLVVFGLSSCEDFFNPEIPTVLNEEDNFTDYLSSRASVNGLYALMQDVMDAYIVNGEIKADMVKTTENANSDLQRIYALDFSLPNRYFDILPFYKIITNANDVIIHLEKNLEKGTSYEEELLNMHAEAVLLRSWVYFYLYRNYNDVPYLTESYTASGADMNIEDWLTANANGYVQLDELISRSESVVFDLIEEYFTETEYFNVASAYAFLGEMYLWENNYEKAIDALLASTHSADNYRFILDSDLEKSKWANIFKGDETAADEIMLKIIFDIGQKQENGLLDLFSSIGPQPREIQPVDDAVELFDSDSYRFSGTFMNSDEIGKYTRSVDNPYTSDMPVIIYRAADVHLMLAEAYNRLGKVALALDLINNGSDSLFTQFSKGIRGRVNMSPIVVQGETLQDSIMDLENKILEERATELAFEGKRWYDLVRIAERRDDNSFMVERMKIRYPESDSTFVSDFYSNRNNWYISIVQK